MKNINLSIAGRSYSVACAPGDEARIAALGRMIDAKLAGNAGMSGQSEARTLLYAALLMADELQDLKSTPAAPVLVPALAPAPAPVQAQADSATAEKLEALADRLESLASRLEDAA